MRAPFASPPPYRSLLAGELARRKARNPRASLRGLAREAGVSPAFLSQVVSGRRGLTVEKAYDVARRLGWSRERVAELALLVRLDAAETHAERDDLTSEWRTLRGGATAWESLPLERFKLMSRWYHMAIAELMTVEGFDADPLWIARRLRISPVEADLALVRLTRAGLCREENGRLVPTFSSVGLDEIPSAAIQDMHRQMLAKAADAIGAQALASREYTTVTVATDPSRIAEAKMRIKRFADDLTAFLNGGVHSTIYQIGLQLFRLDVDAETPTKDLA